MIVCYDEGVYAYVTLAIFTVLLSPIGIVGMCGIAYLINKLIKGKSDD